MRIFIAVLVLIFSLNSLSNADQKNDLIKDANEGDAIAQNNLGFNYLYGQKGFAKNIESLGSHGKPFIQGTNFSIVFPQLTALLLECASFLILFSSFSFHAAR